MNILLGSIYPRSLLNELTRRKLFVDYPANVFQQSLLLGLDEHLHNLTVVTSPVIKSSYSEVKDICKSSRFSHNNGTDEKDIYVGTLPIPGLQMLVELWRVYWAVRKELKKYNEIDNNLIIYALHSPFLLAAVFLRRIVNCTCCVVVPDLPEFMSRQDRPIRRLGKKIDREIINFCLKRLDCYVLLSPYMLDKLPIYNKPWVLLEGIYNASSLPKNVLKSNNRVILYSGNVSRRYGITELLNAFHLITNNNYRLWICGRGDGLEDVLKMSEVDERISYLGVVNHDEVLVLQRKATVLINPRSSLGEYTKYSFPSKTMEYLASGTPTIMFHLPTIPREYDEFIYYIADESVKGIKNKIEEVCEKQQSELDAFGRKAAEFIISQKNALVQSLKIIELMKGCH